MYITFFPDFFSNISSIDSIKGVLYYLIFGYN